MKIHLITWFLWLSLLSVPVNLHAQKAKTKPSTSSSYPNSFTINKTDFDALFEKRPKEAISSKNNKYLDKGTVMMNTLNGDMKFLKVKLQYFPGAYLLVQVNGEYST